MSFGEAPRPTFLRRGSPTESATAQRSDSERVRQGSDIASATASPPPRQATHLRLDSSRVLTPNAGKGSTKSPLADIFSVAILSQLSFPNIPIKIVFYIPSKIWAV